MSGNLLHFEWHSSKTSVWNVFQIQTNSCLLSKMKKTPTSWIESELSNSCLIQCTSPPPRSHPTQTSLLSSSCQRSYWSPYNGQTNQNLAKIGLFQRFSTQGSCVWLEGWLQGVQSHSLSLTRTWRQWSLSSDTGRGTGRQRRRGKDWKEKAEGDSLRGGESWASCLIDIFSLQIHLNLASYIFRSQLKYVLPLYGLGTLSRNPGGVWSFVEPSVPYCPCVAQSKQLESMATQTMKSTNKSISQMFSFNLARKFIMTEPTFVKGFELHQTISLFSGECLGALCALVFCNLCR